MQSKYYNGYDEAEADLPSLPYLAEITCVCLLCNSLRKPDVPETVARGTCHTLCFFKISLSILHLNISYYTLVLMF